MNIKFLFFSALGIFLVLFIMFGIIERQKAEIKEFKQQLSIAQSELNLEKNEAKLRLKAIDEREKDLINDRKGLEDAYNKLREDKNSCQVYNEWSASPLPANVSELLQQHQ